MRLTLKPYQSMIMPSSEDVVVLLVIALLGHRPIGAPQTIMRSLQGDTLSVGVLVSADVMASVATWPDMTKHIKYVIYICYILNRRDLAARCYKFCNIWPQDPVYFGRFDQ